MKTNIKQNQNGSKTQSLKKKKKIKIEYIGIRCAATAKMEKSNLKIIYGLNKILNKITIPKVADKSSVYLSGKPLDGKKHSAKKREKPRDRLHKKIYQPPMT